jgi:HAD superfamily hydrolase (TIGR01509 family)
MSKAILFDMDGLLVDSENLGIEVAVRVCRNLGVELTSEEQRSFIGITDEKFYRELFASRGLDLDVQTALQEHFALYEQLLVSDLKFFQGAASLPKILKDQGRKMALVSGSTRHQIDIILNFLGIADCFSVVVSCDDIATSKPNPEGYLTAANLLGEDPGNCIVLEDAESGIKAGKAAGMKVIGVVNAGMQSLTGSDVQIESLSQIEEDLRMLD